MGMPPEPRVAGGLSRLPGRSSPGLINGLLIARLRVPAFIGTLGMYVARGTGFLAARHHRAGQQSLAVRDGQRHRLSACRCRS